MKDPTLCRSMLLDPMPLVPLEKFIQIRTLDVPLGLAQILQSVRSSVMRVLLGMVGSTAAT